MLSIRFAYPVGVIERLSFPILEEMVDVGALLSVLRLDGRRMSLSSPRAVWPGMEPPIMELYSLET